MASKFTTPELTKATQSDPNHPVFRSSFFFNKLALAILNREVQLILSGDGNIVMGSKLERKLGNSWEKLLGVNSDLVILFTPNDNSQRIRLTPSQHQFIHLKLSAQYLLNEDDRVYLDFIEPWIFSLDNIYGYKMCDALVGSLVARFLPELRSDLSDLHVYLELCDIYFYSGYDSYSLYFSEDPHQASSEKLDGASFPPVSYFFSLISNLLGSASLTYDQYMDVIHRHFYSSISIPLRFQKKLYPCLIERDIIAPVIPSSFAFEDLSQDVLSVILSYVDINSAQNILLVSNVFYFGTRESLTHCHESVFEIYRTSFIEQLLPLFTLVEGLDDKIDILETLYRIYTKSVDHALDPLSIFNTFKPESHKDHPFVRHFSDLISGLYPFAPCISTREYYYLLRPFLLHLLPSTISHAADPLKPFESVILSSNFSFAHFHGYMNSFLSLMKEANLTASALGLTEIDIRYTLCKFSYWFNIRWIMEKRKRLFDLCLMDMSCVLLLLNPPLTREQVNTVIQKLLTEK
jgi:hypothetical protein